MAVPELVTVLDLAAHPEGGWYRRTWTSPVTVPTAHGPRPTATAILYLLDGVSRWHRVRSAELWCWHSGSPVELAFGGDGETPDGTRTRLLGPPTAPGPEQEPEPEQDAPSPQIEVPAGIWQAATCRGDEPALITCVVSPGFDFEDFEMK
ncbi:cupin domain-containing protein [Pseudonocardia sp. KRD-291]|nr:cupin domain-containing protein [Pseudonocardia sp. KRD291]